MPDERLPFKTPIFFELAHKVPAMVPDPFEEIFHIPPNYVVIP